MNKTTLQSAINEARRFLERAEALKEAEDHEGYVSKCKSYRDSPLEQGAVRRASMDLTRMLADLRMGR